jgi:membrane-associated phospholipid phosphatase
MAYRKLENKTIFRYTLIGLSILLGVVVRTGYLDSIEVPYVAGLQQAALNANIMWFFLAFNHVGDSIVWIGLALLLLAYDFRRPKKALKFALFVTAMAIIVIVFRLLFPRSRPFAEFPSLVQPLAFEGLPSYPSGHVAPVAGGFYLLAKHSGRLTKHSRKLNVVFGVVVFVLGLSRVVTGAHYFTDVVGAALFSYPIAAIIDEMKLFERFKERF